MSSDAIVQKYSQALFEIAAKEKTGVLSFETDTLTKLFGSEGAQDFFNSPFNSKETKLSVAKASLEGRCLPEVFNFFVLLVENERVYLVSEINEKFQKLVKTLSGELHGILYSAVETSDAFRAQVEKVLADSIKRKVTLKTEVDADLLSGYKVKIDSWTIDDSAQFHLHKLKDSISRKV